LSEVDAASTLTEVERLRGDTRAALAGSWYPFLLYGLASLLSAPLTLIWDGGAVGIYWAIAAPLAYWLTARHYRDHEREIGAEDRYGHAYAAIGAGIIVVAFLTGVLGQGDLLSFVGPGFGVALGLAAIAGLRMSLLIAVAAGLDGALVLAVTLVEPGAPGIWVAGGQGLVGIAAGLIARRACA